jgi:hypothetical protein
MDVNWLLAPDGHFYMAMLLRRLKSEIAADRAGELSK